MEETGAEKKAESEPAGDAVGQARSASARLSSRLSNGSKGRASRSPQPHRWARGHILELPSQAHERDLPTKAFGFVRNRRAHAGVDSDPSNRNPLTEAIAGASASSWPSRAPFRAGPKYLSTALVRLPQAGGGLSKPCSAGKPGSAGGCRKTRARSACTRRQRPLSLGDTGGQGSGELFSPQILEGPTAVTVTVDPAVRLPPNTWIVLEPLGQEEKERLVEAGTHGLDDGTPCMFDVVGGGYVSEEDAATLRPVPEQRLNLVAAEANFKRASRGCSVLSLRHAAHALELVVQRTVLEKQPQLPPSLALSGMTWAQVLADETGSRSVIQQPQADSLSVRAEIFRRLHQSESLVARRAAERSRRQEGREVGKASNTEPAPIPPTHPTNRLTAKGIDALRQFLDFCNRRFGNLLRAWFELDPEENMRLGEKIFVRRCLDLGFSGNVQALYRYVDNDGNGTISFAELDSASAVILAGFKSIVDLRFEGSTDLAFQHMDTARSGRVRKHQFVAAMREFAYSGPVSRLFDLLDRQGYGYIHDRELRYLASWRPQPYLLSVPNVAAAEAVKECFAYVHGSLFQAWRKALDTDLTMRLSWYEFCVACAELKKQMAHGPMQQPSIAQPPAKEPSEASTEVESLPTIRVAGPSPKTLQHLSLLRGPSLGNGELAEQASMRASIATPHSPAAGSPRSVVVSPAVSPRGAGAGRAPCGTPRSPAACSVNFEHVLEAGLPSPRDSSRRDSSRRDSSLRDSSMAMELPSTEQELASAWRALDADCSGAISLKEFDPKGYEAIATFKKWADLVYGGVRAAMRKLDTNGNGKMGRSELRKALQGHDAFNGDVEALFAALFNENLRLVSLTPSDLAFMDRWDLQWEEWRDESRQAVYEAAMSKRHRTPTCASRGS